MTHTHIRSLSSFGLTTEDIAEYYELTRKFFPADSNGNPPALVVLPDDDPDTPRFNELSGRMVALFKYIAENNF